VRIAALQVKGKHSSAGIAMGTRLGLQMALASCDAPMAADPGAYFVTDHYRQYPWVLVSLAKVHADALAEWLDSLSHPVAASKRRV
jgi:hypothetical protein